MKFDVSVKKKKRRKNILLTAILVMLGVIFVIPIVFTICNSFMEETEIAANYGMVFDSITKGGSKFISETVRLKFIPDAVSFKQYFTVLFNSPDYLLKFWNSVILVVPIVIFQLAVALIASYGFVL